MKVQVRTLDSIRDDLEHVRQQVANRAHQLFRERGGELGRAVDDWLRAENEVVWRPPVEMVQKNDELQLELAAPGVELRDLDVRVTPTDVVVTAPARDGHNAPAATVHVCEFKHGNLFRRVQLPRTIDPAAARADYRNGLLRLTLPVVDRAPRRVEVTHQSTPPSPEPIDAEC